MKVVHSPFVGGYIDLESISYVTDVTCHLSSRVLRCEVWLKLHSDPIVVTRKFDLTKGEMRWSRDQLELAVMENDQVVWIRDIQLAPENRERLLAAIRFQVEVARFVELWKEKTTSGEEYLLEQFSKKRT